jgi:hypothetical protein
MRGEEKKRRREATPKSKKQIFLSYVEREIGSDLRKELQQGSVLRVLKADLHKRREKLQLFSKRTMYLFFFFFFFFFNT